MKQKHCFSKKHWLWPVLTMLILSFVGAFFVRGNHNSKIITSDQAKEKTVYFRSLGFPEYSPQREGYKVLLSEEQKQERINLLVEYIDQLTDAVEVLESQRAAANLARVFEAVASVIEEGKRLELETELIQQALNRLAAVAEKISHSVSGDQGNAGLSVVAFNVETYLVAKKFLVVNRFHLLDVYRKILHIPIFRLVS